MSDSVCIWLARHGETDWNIASRIQGSLDIPLNNTGLVQAECVARRLAAAPIQAIYSSPLSRAFQTARPLARQLDLEVISLSGLAERHFGDLQGKTPAEIAQQDAELYARWQSRDPKFLPKGGESLLQFRDRVVSTMDQIIDERLRQNIAIFTHGGVLDMLYRHASDLHLSAPRTWSIKNASIHQFTGRVASLRIEAWGLVDHLEDKDQRDELR
jgi:2,3-bisphosphoglycerate-dependent phosphoglycerate mutase